MARRGDAHTFTSRTYVFFVIHQLAARYRIFPNTPLSHSLLRPRHSQLVAYSFSQFCNQRLTPPSPANRNTPGVSFSDFRATPSLKKVRTGARQAEIGSLRFSVHRHPVQQAGAGAQTKGDFMLSSHEKRLNQTVWTNICLSIIAPGVPVEGLCICTGSSHS